MNAGDMRTEALRAVIDCCALAGVRPIAISGLALGIARAIETQSENIFIPHDRDLDFGVPIDAYIRARDSIARALLAVGADYVHGWTLAAGLGTQDTWRVCGVSVDLHALSRYGEKMMHFAYMPSDDEDYDAAWYPVAYTFSSFTARPYFLGDISVGVPDNLRAYCAEHYGADWQTPKSKWHWVLDCPCARVLWHISVRRIKDDYRLLHWCF